MTEPTGNMTDDVPPAAQRRGGAMVPSAEELDVPPAAICMVAKASAVQERSIRK